MRPPLVFINALVTEVSHRDPDRTQATLDHF